ncbi:hypothetical protein C8R43DRAFT_952951 [Mycena crocata]|nr:hypothetical protein C8R43DRAFT_952951 [Mycena crocata]
MPAQRHQTRQHRKARKVPPRPLPRITDPYAPPEDPEDIAETMEELRSEEANRVIQNATVALLKQLYGPTEKASTADAEDADIYLDAYETRKIKYEDSFGKFVPDAENAAWFARKAPRAEELRVARMAAMDATDHDDPAMALALDLGEKFEEDFGQAFSDDLNFHFERFASHAASARCLHFVHGDDVTKWAARAEQPVTFDICNPYPEGHHRRGDFDNKLAASTVCTDEDAHGHAPHGDEPPTPPSGVVTFRIVNPYAGRSGGVSASEVLRGFYDAEYSRQRIQRMTLYHWEDVWDSVGEKRENPHSPFVRRYPLW